MPAGAGRPSASATIALSASPSSSSLAELEDLDRRVGLEVERQREVADELDPAVGLLVAARPEPGLGRGGAGPAGGDRHPVVDFPLAHPFDRRGEMAALDRSGLRRALDLVEADDLRQVAEGGRLDRAEARRPPPPIRSPPPVRPRPTCRAGTAARPSPAQPSRIPYSLRLRQLSGPKTSVAPPTLGKYLIIAKSVSAARRRGRRRLDGISAGPAPPRSQECRPGNGGGTPHAHPSSIHDSFLQLNRIFS